MRAADPTFDLKTLSELTGVSPRTVHFYVQQGLLPPPDGAGRGARYSVVHRDRLKLIRRLQDQHLPLAEIRRQLDRIPDALLEGMASAPEPPKPQSAADYIRSVLSGRQEAAAPAARPAFSLPRMAKLSAPPPEAILHDTASLAPPSHTTPVDRSQWERLIVDPDVEIHLRRPTSRATNRKTDKLIEFARSLFKEDA